MKNRLIAPCLAILAVTLACLSLPAGDTPTATNPPPITLTPSTPTPGHPGWLAYRNESCGFEAQYPPEGTLQETGALHARIDLAFTPGTNLSEKYAQIDVEAAATPCLSPLALGYDISALSAEHLDGDGGRRFIPPSGGCRCGCGQLLRMGGLFDLDRLRVRQPQLRPALAERDELPDAAAPLRSRGRIGRLRRNPLDVRLGAVGTQRPDYPP